MENFTFEKAEQLYNDGMLKDRLDCKQYIQKFFFPTEDGHYKFHNGKFKFFNEADIRKAYFNKLPEDISKWYFKKNTKMYEVINDVTKPLIEGMNINMCPGFAHKRKDYISYPIETKKKVDIYLSYMKEVLSNNDEKWYNYILKWLANVANGNKNDTLIYLKGPEGIGKSTLKRICLWNRRFYWF